MESIDFEWNLKKWRKEHGLDTPIMDYYAQLAAKKALVMSIIFLIIGFIIGSYGR